MANSSWWRCTIIMGGPMPRDIRRRAQLFGFVEVFYAQLGVDFDKHAMAMAVTRFIAFLHAYLRFYGGSFALSLKRMISFIGIWVGDWIGLVLSVHDGWMAGCTTMGRSIAAECVTWYQNYIFRLWKVIAILLFVVCIFLGLLICWLVRHLAEGCVAEVP